MQIRAIIRTELNVKNKAIAINTLMISVMAYSFDIINLTLEKWCIVKSGN